VPDSLSRVFEDVTVGEELPPLHKPRLSTAHLMRWAAAVENWHRIHYDRPFAVVHEGLPDVVVNGGLKHQILCELLSRWVGPDGWVAEVSFRPARADIPGVLLTATGRVVGAREHQGLGFLSCELALLDERGERSATGHAIAVLPTRRGPPVPYPFPAARLPPEPAIARGEELTGCPPDPAYMRPDGQALIGVHTAALTACEPVEGGARTRYGARVAPPLFPLYQFRRGPGIQDPLDAASDPSFDGAAGFFVGSFGLPPLPLTLRRLDNGGNRARFYRLAATDRASRSPWRPRCATSTTTWCLCASSDSSGVELISRPTPGMDPGVHHAPERTCCRWANLTSWRAVASVVRL
jgi:hypothetical protein